MSSNFKLGASAGTLAVIDTQFETLRDREPRASTIDFAQKVNVGNGTRLGLGWQVQTWRWSVLSEDMWTNLRAYANTLVYVTTRNNAGTFATYTCLFIFPEEEPEHQAGRVLEAEIELRNLVAVP